MNKTKKNKNYNETLEKIAEEYKISDKTIETDKEIKDYHAMNDYIDDENKKNSRI